MTIHAQDRSSKFDVVLERATGTMRIIKIVLCVISLLSLFSIRYVFFNVTDTATSLCWGVGVLAAMVACPLKLIMLIPKFVSKGFYIGLFIAGVGCIFGALIGLVISFVVVLMFPVIVTVPYLKKNLSRE